MAILTRLAPTRLSIGHGEALDSYLERFAQANDITPPQLITLISPNGSHSPESYAMSFPTAGFLDGVHELTGLKVEDLRHSTLQHFADGLPFDYTKTTTSLTGMHPAVAAAQWFPLRGTQACPQCLAENGQWNLSWRLPIVTACLIHRRYLAPTCSGCGKRFRTRQGALLRPNLDASHECGNTIVGRNHCSHSVIENQAHACDDSCLEVARSVELALAGEYVALAERLVKPSKYLADLRAVATQLLTTCIPTRSTRETRASVQWQPPGAKGRYSRKGGANRVRPPDKPEIRAVLLRHAHTILVQGDCDLSLAS